MRIRIAAALILAVPRLALAACTTEVEADAVLVESCPIAGTDYRVVRSRTTVAGTIGAVIALLQEDAAGPARAHRTVEHRVTGSGIGRRVTVNRSSWWRLESGVVVLDTVGADELSTDLAGTRVRCLRSRWTIAADSPGMVAIVQETVSDPRPPFGLTDLVTHHTARIMHETLSNLPHQLRGRGNQGDAVVESLPSLAAPLPAVGESFARCHVRGR